jgi:uncharacterized protein with HEPN domain
MRDVRERLNDIFDAIVWAVVEKDLPALKEAIRSLL